MISEVSGPAVEGHSPTEIEPGDDTIENKKNPDEPGRTGGPVFDGDIIDEEGMDIPVVVRQVPGGQIAERHNEDDGDDQGDEQPAEAVAEELAGAFAGQGGQDKNPADQEHQ